MTVIRRHANRMHKLVNAIPPRPSCVYPASAKKPLGAWFATNPNGADTGDCINAPDVSLAFYMLYGELGSLLTEHWLGATVVTQPPLQLGRSNSSPTCAACSGAAAERSAVRYVCSIHCAGHVCKSGGAPDGFFHWLLLLLSRRPLWQQDGHRQGHACQPHGCHVCQGPAQGQGDRVSHQGRVLHARPGRIPRRLLRLCLSSCCSEHTL